LEKAEFGRLEGPEAAWSQSDPKFFKVLKAIRFVNRRQARRRMPARDDKKGPKFPPALT
jgi:hypothetical protein